MIIKLILKDIYLIKKYLFLTMILAVIVPLFYAWRAPKLLGFTVIIMTVLLVEVLLVGNLFIEEEKYPKAEMLLCSSPYTRKNLVCEKYIFSFLIFIYCCLAYDVVALLFPYISFLKIKTIFLILLINTALFGVFFPLQYKFGIQSTKLFLSVGVFAFPLILTGLVNICSDKLNSFVVKNVSENSQYIIISFLIIIIEILSINISNKIYSHKEF